MDQSNHVYSGINVITIIQTDDKIMLTTIDIDYNKIFFPINVKKEKIKNDGKVMKSGDMSIRVSCRLGNMLERRCQ